MGALAKPVYRRILLKLSGEALQGDHLFGIDTNKLATLAKEVLALTSIGVEVAVVIGAGNIIRGADLCAGGFDRVTADQMGMLATAVNGLALCDAFAKHKIPAVLMSAFAIPGIAIQHDRRRAQLALQQGNIVIFVAGTGNPLVTTDTAAALRGVEINADIVIKATKVDGVFDKDPIKHPDASRFHHLTYSQVMQDRLGVMDLTAILLCEENDLPLRVFNMNKTNALLKIICGEDIGTLVTSSATV